MFTVMDVYIPYSLCNATRHFLWATSHHSVCDQWQLNGDRTAQKHPTSIIDKADVLAERSDIRLVNTVPQELANLRLAGGKRAPHF